MRLLILGLPRSGTTSLIRGIKAEGYHDIIEPFNGGLQNAVERDYPLRDLYDHDYVVVKNTTYQKPRTWKSDWFSFCLEFFENFDKIIFLDRSDFESHFDSIVHLWYRVGTKSTTMQAWSDEDIPKDFRNEYVTGGGLDKLHKEKKDLRKVIEMIGYRGSIVYYEDLYGENRTKSLEIIQSWELPKVNCERLNSFLHPSRKLYRGEKRQLL